MQIDQRRRRLLQAGALATLATALPGFARTPDLDATSTAEDATAGLDLRGRTIVVTGCTSGIGQETMRVLALRGAHVIGTARSPATGEAACAAVKGRATPVVLDLADFDSVVAASDTIRALDVPLDALVCNAGVVLDDLEQVRGIEKTFVVNHLGHYLLVRRLLDRVTAAPQGRVVVLGSGDERNAPPGGIQFDALSGAGWDARYAHSKLANGLFSLELSRRLAATRATSNCVSPGHTRSNILRNVGNRYRDDARSVQQGAATPCWLAASPAASGINGAFYRDFAPAPQSDAQRDTAMAARLWTVSESLVRGWLPA
ncbi:SDR family NAD(P)-dependent oxidoreductase [Luteimonas fraxinea]|uniref:SDR family NAD(P)-dependent oxidoreductase n=1 Tax=Luteimonas fraxinea TaxID=2901869 RepID=UPI001E476D9A|nr:SDR family NAD(P)-dependent oxidoreductase [Luteimonas fraxinea]MCD9126606.1 SDR family NAD(P)-dependent oxidoreductase [Luteimonas fraxinea]